MLLLPWVRAVFYIELLHTVSLGHVSSDAEERSDSLFRGRVSSPKWKLGSSVVPMDLRIRFRCAQDGSSRSALRTINQGREAATTGGWGDTQDTKQNKLKPLYWSPKFILRRFSCVKKRWPQWLNLVVWTPSCWTNKLHWPCWLAKKKLFARKELFKDHQNSCAFPGLYKKNVSSSVIERNVHEETMTCER